MSTELALGRGHLRDHRRMIIGRSVASAAAGAFPLPLVEDWLAYAIGRGMFQRIAADWGVDLEEGATQSLFYGQTDAPGWTNLVGGTLFYRLITRSWKKIMIAYVAARRSQAAARYYLIGTLFDHYCARLHVGLGLDGQRALELRLLMERAIDETPGGLGARLFRRGLVAATRATVKAPLELADLATGGYVKRLLSRRTEVEAAEEVDTALEKYLNEESSFLSRTARAIEIQVSTEANPYVDAVVDRFDALWRAEGVGAAIDLPGETVDAEPAETPDDEPTR